MPPGHLAQLRRLDEDHAPGERDPVGADDVDGVALAEAAGDVDDAGGEQAGLALDQRPAGPVVDGTVPGDAGGEGDPQLAGGERGRWASKRGARPASSATAPASTPGAAASAITVRTPDHDAIRAASSLLAMPPLPRSLPPPPARIASSGSSAAPGQRARRSGSSAGVGGVEAVEVGEQHEHGGGDDVGDERGEAVVVAVAELVAGDGVVLVDDRHRAELEQAGERAPGVEVLPAVDEVVRDEQRLAGTRPWSPRRRPSCASAGAGRRRRAPAAWRRRPARASARARRRRPRRARTTRRRPRGPPPARSATSPPSLAIAPSSTPPRSSVSDEVPILTTITAAPASLTAVSKLKSPIHTTSPSPARRGRAACITPSRPSRWLM